MASLVLEEWCLPSYETGAGRGGSLSPSSDPDSDRSGSSGRTTPRLKEIVIIGGGGSTGASDRGSDSRPNSRRPSLASSRGDSDAELYNNYSSSSESMKRSSSRASDLGSLPRSALKGLKVTVPTNISPEQNHAVPLDPRNRNAHALPADVGAKVQTHEESNKKKLTSTIADELPTSVTRMLLTVLFERFDRSRKAAIDCDEFQRFDFLM